MNRKKNYANNHLYFRINKNNEIFDIDFIIIKYLLKMLFNIYISET